MKKKTNKVRSVAPKSMAKIETKPPKLTPISTVPDKKRNKKDTSK